MSLALSGLLLFAATLLSGTGAILLLIAVWQLIERLGGAILANLVLGLLLVGCGGFVALATLRRQKRARRERRGNSAVATLVEAFLGGLKAGRSARSAASARPEAGPRR